MPVAPAEGLAHVLAADDELARVEKQVVEVEHRRRALLRRVAGEHVVERRRGRRDERLADMAEQRAIGVIGPFEAGLGLAARGASPSSSPWAFFHAVLRR